MFVCMFVLKKANKANKSYLSFHFISPVSFDQWEQLKPLCRDNFVALGLPVLFRKGVTSARSDVFFVLVDFGSQ